MTIPIENDSYLIIVYGEKTDDVAIEDFKESDKNKISNVSNTAVLDTDLNINNIGKVLLSGITSPLAQSIASKSGLSTSTLGRISSSISDIVANGKISNEEVAEDFIRSVTNELDATAISLGYPTPSQLYDAIRPSGSGVVKTDFINNLSKNSNAISKSKVVQANESSSDAISLKFKIVTADSESWSSELPTRRTEKGFDIVDSVQNDNITKDFEVIIINNQDTGQDMYDIKGLLKTIRKKKTPFDVYINDSDVRKQEYFKKCLFSDISFEPNGKNTLTASLSIMQIPEFEVVVRDIPKRKQAVSTKSVSKKAKTTIKKKASGVLPVSKGAIASINLLKTTADKGRFSIDEYTPLSNPSLIAEIKQIGVNYTPAQLGFTATGGGKRLSYNTATGVTEFAE